MFSSTPIFIKHANVEPDILAIAGQSDLVFIRIDQDYIFHFSISGKLKKNYPNVNVVWIAQNNQYALPAFENYMDGYFELPVTETKIGAVKRRLAI